MYSADVYDGFLFTHQHRRRLYSDYVSVKQHDYLQVTYNLEEVENKYILMTSMWYKLFVFDLEKKSQWFHYVFIPQHDDTF